MVNIKIKSVFFALLVLFTSLVQAGGSAPAATCYPLAHGEDGQGSTNSLYLPHLVTNSKWTASITLTNTSDEYLNVKLNFKSYDGSVYSPYHHQFWGEFNAGNSPFALENGGGILKPGRTAKVAIYDDNNNNSLMGSVSWQADACISEAVLVSVRNHYSGVASTLLLLNDGQPF